MKPINQKTLDQVVDVPWIGPSTNKIWAGVHWRKRKQIAEEAHKATYLAVKQQKIKPALCAVVLEFTPNHKGRHYDVSNYSLTCKGIEDGLVQCGVLNGDSKKYVRKIIINTPVTTKLSGFMRVGINIVRQEQDTYKK